MTLGALPQRFLQHCAVEKRLRPMTIASYRSDFGLFLEFLRRRAGGRRSRTLSPRGRGQGEGRGTGWDVRTRAPITLDEESEPEPDISVVPGGPRDYLAAHPSCPPLVLEVAETTLVLDRDYKTSLYARAQIRDYWVVNLIDAVLEMYPEPVADADAPYGWRYASAAILGPGDHVAPLAAPSVRIAVSDLLPQPSR